MSVPQGKPSLRTIPEPDSSKYRIQIKEPRPVPGVYKSGTAEFLYWHAVDTLCRTVAFWGTFVPRNKEWHTGPTLTAVLVAGDELNAYYDRDDGLTFFRTKLKQEEIFSAESADVLSHEVGHAILDSVRPDLWDIKDFEVAAFHESFGDISTILSVLQIPSFRTEILAETERDLSRSSRLSKMGEQLGWAIRQIKPDGSDSDCLRNAANSLFYQSPESLPPEAPMSILSSQPHSFSRLFTAAFLRVLSGIFSKQAIRSESKLAEVTVVAGSLLMEAVQKAAPVRNFFAEVALKMLEVDKAKFAGEYSKIIRASFVRNGILSLVAGSVDRPMTGTRRRAFATVSETPLAEEMHTEINPRFEVRLSGEEYGLIHDLWVEPAVSRIATHTEMRVSAGAFVADLFRRGRVDVGNFGNPETNFQHPLGWKTHKLESHNSGGLKLVRRRIDCGLNLQSAEIGSAFSEKKQETAAAGSGAG